MHSFLSNANAMFIQRFGTEIFIEIYDKCREDNKKT